MSVANTSQAISNQSEAVVLATDNPSNLTKPSSTTNLSSYALPERSILLSAQATPLSHQDSRELLRDSLSMLMKIAREEGNSIGQKVTPVNSREAIAITEVSKQAFELLLNGWRAYQGFATSSPERSIKSLVQLSPLIQEYIDFTQARNEQTRNKSPVPMVVQIANHVLTHGKPSIEEVNGQFENFNDLFAVRNVSGLSADQFAYLPHAPTSIKQVREIKAQMAALEEQKLEMRSQNRQGIIQEKQSNFSDSPEIQQIIDQIDTLKQRALTLLFNTNDFHLSRCATDLNTLDISVTLNPFLMSKLFHSAQTTSALLGDLCDPETRQKSVRLSLLIPSFIPDEKGPRVDFIPVDKMLNIPLDGHERGALLTSLCSYFLSTRELLSKAFTDYQGERPEDPRVRSWLEPLSRFLGSPFGIQNGERVLETILRSSDPNALELRQGIIKIQTVKTGVFNSLAPAIIQPEMIALYREMIRQVVSGDYKSADALSVKLGNTSFNDAVLFAKLVGHLKSTGSLKQLGVIIDKEITEISAATSSSTRYNLRQAGLLFSLEALSADRDCSIALKASANRLDDIRRHETNLIEGMQTTNASKIVAQSTTEIFKTLKATLDDYLGADGLVADVKKIIDDNQMLLQKREKAPEVDAKLIVLNALVLDGKPGSGKTYLIDCIANTYGYERIVIATEEMAQESKVFATTKMRYGRSASLQSEPEQANQHKKSPSELFTEFLNRKIAELREKMKKSGSRGGIIALDELEVKFLKRDPRTSSRDDIEQTNIMLRVIEKIIKDNPDILFIGTTNHIEQVEPAALRVGRFAITLEVPLVTKEGAHQMVRDTCHKLGFDYNKLSEIELLSSFTDECIKMTPQLVLISIHRSLLLSSKHDPAEEITKSLLDTIKYLKRITKADRFEDPTQLVAERNQSEATSTH